MDAGGRATQDAEAEGRGEGASHIVRLPCSGHQRILCSEFIHDLPRQRQLPSNPAKGNGQPKPGNIDVQQRWFIGAHANVGGGYGAGDSLADIPLQWMLERASHCGLKLEEFKADGSAWKSRPRDSYQEFFNGKYAMLRQWKTRDDGKYHREYAHAKEELKAINVSVDDTVWQRWREDPEYRPKTLLNAGVSPPEQSTQQPDRPTSPDQTAV